MTMQKAWFGLAVLALIGAAWMGRYSTSPYGDKYDNQIVMRHDRWTGSTVACPIDPKAPGADQYSGDAFKAAFICD